MDDFQKSVLRRLDDIEKVQSIHEKDLSHFKQLLENVQLGFSKVHGLMQALEEEMKVIRQKIDKNSKLTVDIGNDLRETIIEQKEGD